MEEARNRYNDLRMLDVILRELNTQETSKQVGNYRRFMNQVKNAVEVRNFLKSSRTISGGKNHYKNYKIGIQNSK